MKPFLKEVAEDVIKQYGNNLSNICLVFPNKKARFFFIRYFAEISEKAQWAPNMMTISLLVRKFTKLNKPDKLSLIYYLYEIFKKISTKNNVEKRYTFSDFYRIGEVILSDFNEIDNWLVYPEQLFRNIKNIHEIENYFEWLSDDKKIMLKNFWKNFSTGTQSEEKRKFIELWNIMSILYKKYKKFLLNKKIAYQGMMYRRLTELIDKKEIFIANDKKKYIFVGFNALNKAEEIFFKYLKKINKADFYWDTDIYYQLDKKQEAGDFLRKNFETLSINNSDLPDNFSNKNKNIEIIGVPLEVGQTKLIPTIIENYNIDNSGENTAIILSDEHLLFPLLHSLPQRLETVNITMGYPLGTTSLFNLIKQYVKLHENMLKNKNKLFYHKDVISLLKHPDIWYFEEKIAGKIISDLETKNTIYIKAKYLIEKEDSLYPFLFTLLPDDNSEEILLTNILNILFLLFDKKTTNNKDTIKTIENEYIYRAYISIKRFREIIKNKNIKLGVKLTANLLKQILDRERIPFSGKTVEGLQVMGISESRNLDFKNLIILGLNEGIFPESGGLSTFISQNVRYIFDMPLLKYRDSGYAYLFYRLLQRAENISLIYNSIINDSNSGEISRFLLQILYESKHKIKHLQFKQDLVLEKKTTIKISKNKDIQHKLNKYIAKYKYCEKRLSASAINSFINCPLMFYFRYIAELKPMNNIEEEVSHASFGTILHEALEKLYKDFIRERVNKNIEKNDFKIIKKRINKYIELAFNKYYQNKEEDFIFKGNQIIIREVLIKYAQFVINADEKYAPFEISSLEEKNSFTSQIDVRINNKIKKIGIEGIIDRIDKKNGIYRIIDYKTGKSDKFFEEISDIFDKEKGTRKEQILQTFFYSMLFADKNVKADRRIIPCIFDVREMNNNNFKANLTLKQGRRKIDLDNNLFAKMLPEYRLKLSELLSELFDTKADFTQTKNKKHCTWCNYKTICI